MNLQVQYSSALPWFYLYFMISSTFIWYYLVQIWQKTPKKYWFTKILFHNRTRTIGLTIYRYVRRQGCDKLVANGGTRSSKVCASLQKILSQRISWRPKLCISVVDVTSRVDCMRQMSWARLAKCVTWAIFVLILYEASTYILDYYLLPLKIMGSKWIEQMVPLDVYLRICCNE